MPIAKPIANKLLLDRIYVSKDITQDEQAMAFLFILDTRGKTYPLLSSKIIEKLQKRLSLSGGAFEFEDLEGHGVIEIDHNGDHPMSLTTMGRDVVQRLLSLDVVRIKVIHAEVLRALNNNSIDIRIEHVSGEQSAIPVYLN